MSGQIQLAAVRYIYHASASADVILRIIAR